MAELMEITAALDQVRGFNRLERILLTCSGTLQGTLSAYFGREVGVKVIEQSVDENGIIRRLAHLHEGNVVVCEALSQLTICRADVRDQVLEKSLGIGQVLETLGLRPSFELDEAGRTREHLWRRYTLRASGVQYAIKEMFPRWLYQPEAWMDTE